MNAVILAAGTGTKIWPYGEVRPKALIPIANRPLVSYLTDDLAAQGARRVTVVASQTYGSDLRGALRKSTAEVLETAKNGGTADTLLAALEGLESTGDVVVLYGDTLVAPEDLGSFLGAAASFDAVTLLLAPLDGAESRDWIGAVVVNDRVERIVGHPRAPVTHRFAGFALPKSFMPYLEACPSYFPSVEVGMMPPRERHLEAALEMWRRDGRPVRVITCKQPEFDLDKPWHILEVNRSVLERLCGTLAENELAAGASIDPSATLGGPVRLGRGSVIGKNVIIRGRVIAGDNTRIDAGAILNGDAIVGDRSLVTNGCYVEGGTVIGTDCVVNHAAEVSGVVFDGAYLYHYMEINGIVGRSSDIGAATVCGSLRFDDGKTMHRVKGRLETPSAYANASYIGDYCRTGVNATIMPGVKTGPYSLVGPAVLLEDDLPAGTGVRVDQQQRRFPWGPERYGW